MLAVWTWVLLSASGCLGAYAIVKKFARKRRAGEPPIVEGSLLLGSAGEFSRHAVKFLHAANKRYGDVFTIRLVNQYLTVIMDPQSYEAVSREKHFDFDPIQKQVNMNVFSYILREPKKMLTETTKTVKGDMMMLALDSFVNNLDLAHDEVTASTGLKEILDGGTKWQSDGLRHFASRTIFDAIFNTIFGRSEEHPFNSALAFENFETFHQYFNYLWLGFPIGLFPKATKAHKEMLCMPDSDELLARPDISIYLRRALEFMQEHEQTELDMKGHNLVYLHVNYNTFRLAFWVLSNLLEDPTSLKALTEEVERMKEKKSDASENSISLGVKDLESMKVLDSIVQESCRLASGVFMVRYITEDTQFSTDAGDQFLMRKGDRVAMYPPALHKDPEIFEDPEVFKYDRFLDAKFYKSGKELRHPVMAFGTICPGKRYALLQLKWYILTIVTRFELRLQPGQHAAYDSTYYGHEILPPVSDVQIQYATRDCYTRLRFEH